LPLYDPNKRNEDILPVSSMCERMVSMSKVDFIPEGSKGIKSTKLPKSIRVDGIDYAIEQKPDLNNGSNVMYGEVSYTEAKISINTNIDEQLKELTLWHELVHIILNNADMYDERDNEKLVNAISTGLYQIIQDNKVSK
jgi:Zn-dependent peptidase ImmA (M78 family)